MALVASALASVVLASGVHGVVTRGPTSPVCRVGVPCTEPAARVLLHFTRGGVDVPVRTDALGRFRVTLPPGRWRVGIEPKPAVGSIRPVQVVVPLGRCVRVDVKLDTGIR